MSQEILETSLEELEETLDSQKEDMFYNISPEVFKSAIVAQIRDPLSINSYTVNQLSKFDDKISILLQEAEKNDAGDNIKQYLHELRDEVYDDTLNMISEKFNLDVDTSITSDSITKILYDFYIIGYREYCVAFFYGYIMANRKDYHRQYSEENKLNNNPVTASKKLFKESKDAFIIGNLFDIIHEIMTMDISDNDFFDYIIDSGIVDSTIVRELKRNFISSIVVPQNDSVYEDFLSLVQEDISNVININSELQDRLMDVLKIDNPTTKLIPDGMYDNEEETPEDE